MADDRIDSGHILTGVAQSIVEEILPPEELNEDEMRYWNAIISARHAWTDIDLFHAVSLAQTFSELKKERAKLKEEGTILTTKKGTPVMNPRHTAVDQLIRTSTTLSTKLQVHAQATMGISRDQQKKNSTKQEIAKSLSIVDDEDDELIARPKKGKA